MSEPSLRRQLNSVHVQLISLGGIIGSCYFLGLGSTIAEVGPAIVLAFLLGGGIVWLVANAMGELCVTMPREGGFVAHAHELVGPSWAAGVGWSYWINWCAYVPSEMIAGGLVMHLWFPSVPPIVWACAFGVLIAVINLSNVKHFGTIESGLALVKIAAIALFTLAGILLWAGVLGEHPRFIGASVITSGQGVAGMFPIGVFAIIPTMVMILVNFQGTEIIALSAAETKDPGKNIPIATRNVAIRIIAIYVVPLIVLTAIFPYREATSDHPAFAAALGQLGWRGVVGAFHFVILTAAISCANSGLYGSIRSLYALSREGLAPAWLGKLSSKGVPHRATLVTLGVCLAFLPLYAFFEGTAFYTWLLSVSGFTGAICWISISWCQILLRRREARTGQVAETPFRAPGYPFLSYTSVVLQLACMALVALHPELRSCLYVGIPALLVPMGVMALVARRRRSAPAPAPAPVRS